MSIYQSPDYLKRRIADERSEETPLFQARVGGVVQRIHADGSLEIESVRDERDEDSGR